ncbi:hypothetical protein GCM10010324_18290 [Streptomyces hiroshimensis]|uniref:Uncharacterized protein n=1 Tax=Streptomyces hiroshimensis TaxID=66424 RepID=A0ABQ2Y7Z0_9ACTN|nr:hypothetical protein GCM10010324_18290 [Streptomyces hiroshimensis]
MEAYERLGDLLRCGGPVGRGEQVPFGEPGTAFGRGDTAQGSHRARASGGGIRSGSLRRGSADQVEVEVLVAQDPYEGEVEGLEYFGGTSGGQA